MSNSLNETADHLALQPGERGKQGRGAVALVVVGAGFEPAFLHGQRSLGAGERLDLGFCIDRQHPGVAGGST